MKNTVKHIIIHVCGIGLVMGLAVGIFTWGFLFLVNFLIDLIWVDLYNFLGINQAVFTIIIALIGGVVIGLGQKYIGRYPREMHDFIHDFREHKKIDYKPLIPYTFCAFLPLMFGGAVGPEAALFGTVAMLVTLLADKMRSFTVEFKSELIELSANATLTAVFQVPIFSFLNVKDEKDARRVIKIMTFTFTTIATWVTIKFLNYITGTVSFVFKFERGEVFLREFVFIIPLIIISILIATLFRLISKNIEKAVIKSKLRNAPFIASVLAGLAVGIFGALIPLTLFSGEHSLHALEHDYITIGIAMLFIIAISKFILTRFCISLHWIGGQIFPIIYSSVAIAYASSLLFGLDPTFCIAIVGVGILAATLRKPIGAGVLMLFFLPYIYWIPAFISVFIIRAFIKFLDKKTSEKIDKTKNLETKTVA